VNVCSEILPASVWFQRPQTAMPSTNVSEQDARDMAAYLYALN
jgi:hypothetical protein